MKLSEWLGNANDELYDMQAEKLNNEPKNTTVDVKEIAENTASLIANTGQRTVEQKQTTKHVDLKSVFKIFS